MTRIYGDQGTYVYTFTYYAAGLLNKSTWTLDNKDDGTETYTYTNGQITKVNYKYASWDQGVNNIKYDAAGNILEFSYEPEDKSYHNIQYFEYDADGVFTKHGYKDVGGSIYFEAIRNPTKSVKSPENYLKAHGLPYDVLTGFSWSTNMGGEGTTIESFNYDEKGTKTSAGVPKTKGIKLDSKGYLSEITYESADKTVTKSTFTLAGCN